MAQPLRTSRSLLARAAARMFDRCGHAMDRRSTRQEARIPVGGDRFLSAELHSPQAARRAGSHVVVMVHGFVGERTEGGLLSGAADELTARGHWVLLYDWRGLGDSRSTSSEFGETTLMTHARDFQAVVAWLRKSRLPPDDASIVPVGFSLGCALIGLALRCQANARLFSGCAFISPAFNPRVDMWPRYEAVAATGVTEKSGVALRGPILASLKATDVRHECLSFAAPILICHGSADARIPIRNVRRHVRPAESRADVSFHALPGAGHSFREPAPRRELIGRLATWIGALPQRSMSADSKSAKASSGRRGYASR